MGKRNRKRAKDRGAVLTVMRAALIACGAAVSAVALLTLLVYLDVLSEDAVSLIGAALKILGAVLAAFLAGRNNVCRRAWVCGGLSGAAFAVLSTLCMFLLAGEWALSWGILGDVLMAFACGACTAALMRMFKKPAA